MAHFCLLLKKCRRVAISDLCSHLQFTYFTGLQHNISNNDVLNNVLKNNPEVQSVHLWSDNAACYKCTDTLININNNKPSKGHIVSYNFCEAQDGKGACDRAAALFRSGIKRFVNQGNDVGNAMQIKTVRLLKAYGIGAGLLIPWTTIVETSQYALCPLLVEEESCTEDLLSFGCVQKLKNEENNEESLFTCPTDGCMKSFSKYKDLELHLHVNNCTLVPEKQCRINLTKTLYVEKLKTTRPVVKFSDTVQSSGETDLDQGWALRKQRKHSRYNDKQNK
ncbi:unnamed protein product [Mytilus edulis]|uniref:C2H2-type domain-containing protein n=1 Tax=Mytilus edulis TaxID=6550 RepID=A0A8S3SBG4_MYTED|nr:unnamed protein product [Mytilus edulis]